LKLVSISNEITSDIKNDAIIIIHPLKIENSVIRPMTGVTPNHNNLLSGETTFLMYPHIYQDTSSMQVRPGPANTNLVIPAKDSINTEIMVRRKFSPDDIDSIFRMTDTKQLMMDSIIRNRRTLQKLTLEKSRPDSSELINLPYNIQFSSSELNTPDNFINNLKTSYFHVPDTGKSVFYEQPAFKGPSDKSAITEISGKKTGESSLSSGNKQNPDWILLVFIVLLIVMAWLKLFYNKFFDQTIQSVFNYQLSAKVLRDQNIFSRRVSLILNLNFIFITGMFFFLAFNYFDYHVFTDSGITRYFIMCGIISLLLLARYFIIYITGKVFDRKDLFNEYQHEILLIYKNLGIYLIPLVIGLAYITSYLKIYLIYSGLVLLILAYLWRFFKGFQIIINKDILIFYLILYLCILEILPVLVAYRFVTGLL